MNGVFSIMELDCLSIYILRRHEKPENKGLSNIYGEADNALRTARKHFDRMILSVKECSKIRLAAWRKSICSRYNIYELFLAL